MFLIRILPSEVSAFSAATLKHFRLLKNYKIDTVLIYIIKNLLL